ncbi:cytochrome c4 [Betaproteobacteria bacterium SCN2]|jgi:cytochrome c553|nr:cytochrome c4 [Betaproteobacteria bacterium SCN2]
MKTQLALILAATLSVPALAAEPVAKGDPKAATSIVTQVCAACHSTDGNSATPANPTIAGQGYEYLYKQLMDFKSGERKNPVMAGIVANLSPADMKNLAAYFSEKQAKPRTAKDKDKALLGQKIYRGGVQGSGVPACASCHGADGRGIPVQFPRLAGQHAAYTQLQLNSFRAGERANDAAKMMRVISAKMTPQEMEAVAQYIEGMR